MNEIVKKFKKYVCGLLVFVFIFELIPFNVFVTALINEFGPIANIKAENTTSKSSSNLDTNSVSTDQNTNMNEILEDSTEENNNVENNSSTQQPSSPDEVTDDTLIGDIITTEDGYRIQMNSDGKSYSIIEYFGISKIVEIPSTYFGLPITKILDTAFYGNKVAQKIIIPESVVFIGEYTFYNLRESYSYTEYENGNYIGSPNNPYYYFVGPTDTTITEITLHNDAAIVGSYAFAECENLKAVTIGNNVISMGYAVFGKSSKVEKITIPFIGENGKNSKNSHFGYIFGARTTGGNISYVPLTLKEVNVSGGSYIEHNSMYGVDMIESITLPFLGSNINDTENNYFSYIYGGNNYEDNVIPQSIKNVSILGGELGYGAFYNAISIKKIELSNNNVNNLNHTFYNCTSLESVKLPNNLINIEKNVFYNCTSLNNIFLPKSVSNIGENSFYNCSNLLNVIFEENSKLLNIEPYAFRNCTSLESIMVPDGVSYISSYTFDNCINLKNITLPNNLTSIEAYAFNNCNNLNYYTYDNSFYLGNEKNPYLLLMRGINTEITSVNVNENTKHIYFGAFKGCTKLTKISLPFIGNNLNGTLSNVFGYVFGASSYSSNSNYVPTSLIEVNITGGTSIGPYAFYNCANIENIIVPDSIINIGQKAFYGCDNLQYNLFENAKYLGNEINPYLILMGVSDKGIFNININENSKILYYEAFKECLNLTSVLIPNSVISIGEYSFYGCTNLQSIGMSNNVSQIPTSAFEDCVSLEDIILSESVNSIGDRAFKNCTSLKSVTIPNGVPHIYYQTFYNCISLEKAIIPNSVMSIDYQAFHNCTNLEEIVFEDNSQLSSISDEVFCNCTSLTSIVIPKNVENIGLNVFKNCTSLESLTIPFVGSSLNAPSSSSHFGYLFGASSYQYNADCVPITLKNVIITRDTNIGWHAFENCSYIESITIPKSLNGFESYSFLGCYGLNDVYYTGTIEEWCEISKVNNDSNPMYYGEHFYMLDENNEYYEVTEITIPNSLTNITYDFSGFNYLTKVTIPNSVTIIGEYAFYGCSNLTSIIIPNSVTSIGSYAFQSCSNLKELIFEEDSKLINIGNYAFYWCRSLQNIKIPNSVTSIGSNAFNYCYNLKEVIFEEDSKLTTIGISTFKYCDSLENITLPFIGNKLNGVNNNYFGYIFGASSYLANSDNVPVSLKEVKITGGTFIESYAFYGCSNIENIIIPEGVTSIEFESFKGCSNLKTIIIPNSVINIDEDAFSGCSNLEYNIYDNAYYLGNETNLYVVLVRAVNRELSSVKINDNTRLIYVAAFSNCSSIESITIPNSITSIGSNAFYNCYNLKEIIFEKNSQLTSIEENAFYYCETLQSITIPNSVTSIGSNAFYNCFNLKEVIFEENSQLASIEFYVFYNCSSIESITIPNSVISIGDEVFEYCSNLKEVIFEENSQLTRIGHYAFYYCSKLENITIPNSVKIIGESAFKYCSNLKEVIFEENSQLTNIVSGAFSNCSNLRSITIPNSVTSIGSSAFYKCTNLEKAYYHGTKSMWETIVSIDSGNEQLLNVLFFIDDGSLEKNIKNLKRTSLEVKSTLSLFEYIEFSSNGDGTCSIIGIGSFEGTELIIPEVAPNGDVVVEIKSNAFLGNINLTSIIIPNSVTYIGNGAFKGCENLENISLPFVGSRLDGTFNYLGYIFGASSYSYNGNFVPTSLKNVTVTGGASIGQGAFYKCSSIESINIPNSVTNIGSFAFYKCSSLKNVLIPESVTNIEMATFSECTNLENVTLSNNVTNIGEDAFYNCASLLEVVIPNSVTNIGEGAFSGCSSLESITLPFIGNTLNGTYNTHFGYIFGASNNQLNADYVPTSLKDVVITGGISIGSYAFYKCTSIENITIPNSITSIGSYAFYSCGSLSSITIPSSVTSIGKSILMYCNNLESIILPFLGNELKVEENNYLGYLFGASSYQYNADYVPISLKDVVITGGISIGSYAFYKCTSIENITIPNSITSIGSYAFYSCGSLSSVTIPNSVTSIGSSAFENCTILENIIIPANVENIDNYAFADCINLKELVFDERCQIKSIGIAILDNCDNLQSITIPFIGSKFSDTSNSYFGYLFGANSYYYNNDYVPISLKEVIITKDVSIKSYAFYNCENIEKIIISNSATSIGQYAFSYCDSLTSITIPNSVTSIGDSSFNYCYGLKEVIFEENSQLISIGNYAFWSCSSITSVIIPNSVTYIGYGAFEYCNSLESLSLPFVGSVLDGTGATNFGYIFGAESTSYQGNVVPVSLKNVIITGGLNIDSEAFNDCKNLEEVNIANCITSLGNRAFYGCSNLKEVIFEKESKLISIGYEAFAYCTSLESIIIPDSLMSIQTSVFYSCNNLQYNIHNNAYYLGDENNPYVLLVKVANKEISNVIINNQNKLIYSESFSSCSKLKSITIPNSVTVISYDAFYNCSSLESVYYNGTIEEWCNIEFGSYYSNPMYYGTHFYILDENNEYYELTELVIPDNVTKIGINQFYGFDNITKVTISRDVMTIGNYAFEACSNLRYIYYNGTIEEWCNIEFDSYYSNPMYYGTHFYILDKNNDYYELTELIIPDNVTKIGINQFYGFDNITKVVIPNDVMTIENYAFRYCSNLQDVYYNGTIEEWCNIKLGSYYSNPMYYGTHFYILDENNDYYELTELIIPDNVTKIGINQFYGFNNITKVIIPNGVISIGEYSFASCNSLTNIEIPNSVISIGKGAFVYCNSLEKITLPFVGHTLNGITDTDFYYIFDNDSYYSNTIPSKLKEVVITSGSNIDDNAFYNCIYVESITLPNTMISIGSNVFTDCSNLVNLYYNGEYNEWRHVRKAGDWNKGILIIKPRCLKVDSDVLYEVSDDFEEFYVSGYIGKNGNAYIPELYSGRQITMVYERAFDGNESVTSINLPESVLAIGKYAFRNCINLEKINFPRGLNTIEHGILYGCTNIKKLELPFLGEVREYEDNEFIGYYFGGRDYSENIMYVPETLESVKIVYAEQISDYCFSDVVGLQEFIIPDNVTKIGIKILNECNKVQTITIGASLEEIDDFNFGYSLFGINKNNSMLKKFIVSPENIIFASDEYGVLYRTIEIPYSKGSERVKVEVVDVPKMANLSSYTVPDHIVSIAPYAFAYNSTLRMIDLTYVRRIANNAFYQVPNLVNVTLGSPVYTEFENEETEFKDAIDNAVAEIIPEGEWEQVYYQYIGNSAFRGCHSLLKIDIDTDNIIGIGDYAFADCPKLRTIILGEKIEHLGLAVFSATANGDSNIERFVVDEENKHFKSIDGVLYSVNSDNSLTLEIFPAAAVILDSSGKPTYETTGEVLYKDSFELPKGVYVKAIQTYAFQGTKELKEVVLNPEDELIVGDYAFANSSIQIITIGENVISLGLIRGEGEYTIFSDADYMTEIIVDDNNQYYSAIEGVLFDKDQTTLIKYPTAKGDIAIYDIPDTVQTISAMAFKRNQEINRININSHISTIGLEAFYACNNLEVISFKDVYAPNSIMENAFTTFVEVENGEIVDPETKIGYSLANYYDGPNGEIGWKKYENIYNLVENTSDEIVNPLPEEDNDNFYAVVVIDSDGNQLGDMLVSITDPFGKTETVRTSNGAEGKGTAIFYDLAGDEGFGLTLDFTLPYIIKVADQRNIYYTYESTSIYLDEEMRVTYITLVRKPCDVTFNINGGNGYIETINVLVGEDPETGEAYTYDIDNSKVTRPGYTLAGWGTSADGVVKYTNSFSTNKYKAHYILYAIWEPNINVVHFEINGGDKGEMLDVNIKTDSSIELPLSTFVKNGYEFIGWALTPDGGVEYGDNEIFTAGIDPEYTLYAKYTANENILQFVSGGGQGSIASKTVRTDDKAIVPENEFIRDGYTFSHWVDDNNKELNPGDEYIGTPAPVQTLTAVWTPNIGILSFNANTAKGNMASIELASDETITLPKSEFDKLGYIIIGWATSPNGAPVYDSVSTFKMPTVENGEEIILYAVWAEGAEVNGLSCDQSDINTEKFELNKAQYDYECPVQGKHSHEEGIICENGIIHEVARVGVIVYCDPSFGYSIFDKDGLIDSINGIYQNGHKVANVSEVVKNDSDSITVYFDVPVYTLLTEVDIVAEIALINEHGERTRCENVLNIYVIDFIVTEDDINLDANSFGIDLSTCGATLIKLLGKDSFDFNLSKNVKFTTIISGDTVELKLSASKKFSKNSVTTDYEKGYDANHGDHNKNTYFFQYKATIKDSKGVKHNLVYNVRFARATEADNYYYYRCYVYEGNYDNKITLYYGAVNGLSKQKSTRAELAPKAFLIYQSHYQAAKDAKDIDKIKKIGKGAHYIEAISSTPEVENSHAFNMGLEGNLVFQYDKEKGLVPVSSRIKGTLEYTFKHNSQFVVWVIPIVLEVEVKIGGEIVLNLKFDEDRKLTFEDASLTLNGSITASAGVGCSVASVGVYGSIGLVFVLDIYPEFGVNSLKANGEIGGYVKIAFKKYTAKFASFDEYLIGPKEEQQLLMLMSDYELASMYLIENYTNAEATELESDFRLLVIGGKLYKLGYMDVSSYEGYDEYNYAKLYISCWNGEEWSEPFIIDDNGKNDVAFNIYKDDEDLVLTYTQITDTLTSEDDNYDSFDSIIIKSIVLDSQTISKIENGISVESSIERSNYVYLTQYALVDGIPTLIWVENADNNVFGVSPDNYIDSKGVSHVFETNANSIWMSTFENGVWSNPKLIEKDLPTITDLAIGNDGNVAYIIDKNCDLADMNDRIMYYGEIGSEITAYNKVTLGSIISVDFKEGKFVYYYDVVNETEDNVDGLRTISQLENNDIIEYPNNVPATYKIVEDNDGNEIAIFYFTTKNWEVGGEKVSGSALYAVFKENGVWGKPIEIVDVNSESDESFKTIANRYINTYDAVIDPNEDNSIIMSIVTFDENGSNLQMFDFIYEMKCKIVVNDYTIDYVNQNININIQNYGAVSSPVYISTGNEYVQVETGLLSGENKTYVISLNGSNNNKYNLYLSDADGGEIIWSVNNLDLNYSDFSPFAKQLLIGQENNLLVAVKNTGNINDTVFTVIRIGEFSSNNIISSKVLSVINSLSLNEGESIFASFINEKGENETIWIAKNKLDSNQFAYHEVILSELIFNENIGIISIATTTSENEKGNTKDNNYVYVSYNECVGSLKGEETISYNPVIFENNVEFDYMNDDSIEINYTCGITDYIVDILVDNKVISSEMYDNNIVDSKGKITIISEYLKMLSDGKHPVIVNFASGNSCEIELRVIPYYTVTWQDDGNVISEVIVKEGTVPSLPTNPNRENEGEYIYIFLGWDKDYDGSIDSITPVKNDVTYQAVWQIDLCEYVISWVMISADGNIITVNEVYQYYDMPQYLGNIYTPDGMIFVSWDSEINNVTKNVTYTAQYEQERQMGDVNGDGKVNTRDVAMLRQYVVGKIELDDETLAYCNIYEDYNYDGSIKINTRDVALLQQLVVGIEK